MSNYRDSKLRAIQTVLNIPEYGDWYKLQHGVSVDQFNHENIMVYGSTGLANLCDLILEDRVKNGLIDEQLC